MRGFTMSIFLLALTPILGVAGARPDPMAVQNPKVLVLNFDPLIPSEGNRPLHEVLGWNDPASLAQQYATDIATSSHGLVEYRVVAIENLDLFPVKIDGFRYTNGDRNTPGSYLYHWYHGGWHQPDGVDYRAILLDYDVAWKVETGAVDEVWLFGAPYFGYWESTMAGKNAFYVNGGPIDGITCSRKFAIMGFSYERWIGEMMEDLGHRSESTFELVWGGWGWGQRRHDWERFTLADLVAPGDAACGTVHFAPNSEADYDWGNPRYVWSTANDWLINYPNLTGQKDWVNCTAWGGGDSRLHKIWWFSRFPHVAGRHEGRLNNWWAYLIDMNGYIETRGLPGSTYDEMGDGAPAGARTITIRRISTLPGPCFTPGVDASGRVLYAGNDGNDLEISVVGIDGADPIAITANTYLDARPRISGSGGWVAWQALIGYDHEIFTARSDGSALTRVTENGSEDLAPDVNATGQVVWFAFDGTDHEIFSANADGTQARQLTSNGVDDVYPRLNDAGRVVWMSRLDGDWEIASCNVDGSGYRRITVNSMNDERPVLNRAGRIAWCARLAGENWEIYTADTNGSLPVRVTNNSWEDWWPQLSDDGRLVWMSYQSGGWEIWEADAAGANVRQVTADARDDTAPYAGHGGMISWMHWDGADHEVSVRASGVILQVTDNQVEDLDACLSPAGGVVWIGEDGVNGEGSVFSADFSDLTTHTIQGTVSGPTGMNPGVYLVPDPITGTSGLALTDAQGAYTLTVVAGWSGRVRPERPGYEFDPPERTYVNVQGDLSGEDYTGSEIVPEAWTLTPEAALPATGGQAVSLAFDGAWLYYLEGAGEDDGGGPTGNGFWRYAGSTFQPLESPPLARQTNPQNGETIQSNLYVSMGSAILEGEASGIWMVCHAGDNHDYWGGNRDVLRYEPSQNQWTVWDNTQQNTGANASLKVGSYLYVNWQGYDAVSRFDVGGYPASVTAFSRATTPGNNLWPGALGLGDGTTIWGTHPVHGLPSPAELYHFDGSEGYPLCASAQNGMLPPGWGEFNDGQPIGALATVPALVSRSGHTEVWVLRGGGTGDLAVYDTETASWIEAVLRDPGGTVIPFSASDIQLAGGKVYFVSEGGSFLYSYWLNPAALEESVSAGLALEMSNPAFGHLRIRFELPVRDRASLTLHDLEGRQVRRLVDRAMEAGAHTIHWNGRREDGRLCPPGVYFVRIRAGSRSRAEKVVLLP